MLMVDLHKMLNTSFFAQYLSEVEQVVSHVSIALQRVKEVLYQRSVEMY